MTCRFWLERPSEVLDVGARRQPFRFSSLSEPRGLPVPNGRQFAFPHMSSCYACVKDDDIGRADLDWREPTRCLVCLPGVEEQCSQDNVPAATI
jgi:hypothetical protein